MFVHLLAGSLVFLFLGKTDVDRIYLLIGAFWGIVPDLISYTVLRTIKFDKWAHTHRDNFSHSIFLPIIILVFGSFLKSKMTIMESIAVLTHSFLDLFGIGWGVMLFYPFSKKTFKLFYEKRLLTVWDQEEVDAEVKKSGDNHWIKNIYFKPNFIGALEWVSLVLFLFLVY
jgi:hypothetical protein